MGLVVPELVINALKHAFPGGRPGHVLVGYAAKGADWTLSVSDDGVGMAEGAERARAGLGTRIVQALAKQLGADIAVEDAAPGTTKSRRFIYRHPDEGRMAALHPFLVARSRGNAA